MMWKAQSKSGHLKKAPGSGRRGARPPCPAPPHTYRPREVVSGQTWAHYFQLQTDPLEEVPCRGRGPSLSTSPSHLLCRPHPVPLETCHACGQH